MHARVRSDGRCMLDLFDCRKARSLDADLHVISTSLKSVEISEQMVGV